MTETDLSSWNDFLLRYPNHHLLQMGEWGTFKAGFGWAPRRILVGDTGAQVLFRRLPLGWTMAYLPYGPVGKPTPEFWQAVDRVCRQNRAIFLKVEPDCWDEDFPAVREEFSGFTPSDYCIQPPRTIVIDLDGDEEAWLGRMKQKTRYNVRLASKKEVVVETTSDLDLFHGLMQTTGSRDGFGVHSREYYQKVYEQFHPAGKCEILVARFGGLPLAALMVFAQGDRAYYLYGASSDLERNRMAPYLLQFEAMRWAKAHGCRWYDLWGVPDADEETLEAQFETRSDGLWGVYRFKRGFGGLLKRSAGALDRVYRPLLYRTFRLALRLRRGEM